MPRGNRVLMLRSLLRDKEDENGDPIKVGYEEGKVYNLPPHLAKKYVKHGYAEMVPIAPNTN